MQKYSDEELIQEFNNPKDSRRQDAFDCLYMRYVSSLTNYFFFALNRDIEKARDFAHDLFLKLLESPDKFNPAMQFKPWVYRVAANMCKNEHRQKTVARKFTEHTLAADSGNTEIRLEDRKLNYSIRKLNPDQRSLIVLRFKINLSIKEIAEICDCPEGTVKSRLFYALKELSKLYKE